MSSNYVGNPTATESPSATPGQGVYPTVVVPADADPNNVATMFSQQYPVLADFIAYVQSRGIEENFGDGSDGDVTLSSATTTLTRDMFYNNLTIPTGKTLATAGFRVFVKNTLTITSTGAIANDGIVGAAGGGGGTAPGGTGAPAGSLGGGTDGGAGGTPGNPGTNGTAQTSGLGGVGGNGHAGINAAGNGGTVAAPTAVNGGYRSSMTFQTGGIFGAGGFVRLTGGSGGGGGGSSGSDKGSGAGGGGGVVLVCARSIVCSGGGPHIRALGGMGGDASTANTGGGGGGGGGLIILYANRTSGLVTSVAGGVGQSAIGLQGSTGASGLVLTLLI